jgi:hypothetical protein
VLSGLVTKMVALPAVPAGTSHWIWLELSTRIDVAGFPCTSTVGLLWNPLPVITMVVPHVSGPTVGATELMTTTGGGGGGGGDDDLLPPLHPNVAIDPVMAMAASRR